MDGALSFDVPSDFTVFVYLFRYALSFHPFRSLIP